MNLQDNGELPLLNKEYFHINDIYEDRSYEIKEYSIKIWKILDCLPNRMKQIIFLHYKHGLNFREIGDCFNVTSSRINQIEQKAFRLLKKYYLLNYLVEPPDEILHSDNWFEKYNLNRKIRQKDINDFKNLKSIIKEFPNYYDCVICLEGSQEMVNDMTIRLSKGFIHYNVLLLINYFTQVFVIPENNGYKVYLFITSYKTYMSSVVNNKLDEIFNYKLKYQYKKWDKKEIDSFGI